MAAQAIRIALLAVAFSSGAMAQQVESGAGPLVITITKADCSRLIAHQPSPDVAYKPGVDVKGRPVVSADADPAQAAFARKVVPDVLEIPITINPINYGARNTANRQKADAAAAVAVNTKALATAKTQGTTLASQLTSLNSQKTALATTYNSDTAANIASTGGATTTDTVLLLTRQTRQAAIDEAYNAKLAPITSQISTVTTAITANTATQTSLQSQDTTLRQTYTDTNMATEGSLAGYSAKGLDSTQMKVGVVKYDIARNSFTFNGEPMMSEDQQKLAAACAKQGVR